MTEDRRMELLNKINMVATNDPKASPDPESDIKVSRVDDTDSLIVDVLVHFVIVDIDYDDRMDIHFAACKGLIHHAN